VVIRELAIPFMGSLVPGIYLWMGLLFSIVPPLSLLLGSLSASGAGAAFNFLDYLTTITQSIKSGSWVLFIVISYVLGAILSKQDPKLTDQKSFDRISSQFEAEGKDPRKDLACTSRKECEYPYPFLYDYLEKRGLTDLLDYIVWHGRPDQKSKAYINQLKIEVELKDPAVYQNLVRNEAHIRLSNTIWHSTILLRYCSLFGIALVALSSIILLAASGDRSPVDILGYCLGSIAFPAFILMIGEYFRVNIEKYFHFQRLREFFCILRTHYMLFKAQAL
jgi:hypothetical protein